MLPIFIASIAAFFGFKNHYFAEADQLLSSDYRMNFAALSKPLQSFEQDFSENPIYSKSAFSEKKLYQLTIPDSIGKEKAYLSADSIFKKDTVIVKFSKADSVRFKAKEDSLKRIDSLSQDSTARIQHFRYKRIEKPYLSFRPKRAPSLISLLTENIVLRTMELDSTGKKVVIKETIAGQKVRPPLELPLDEYIRLRLDAIARDAWEARGYEYKLKEDKRDITQFITDITNIDIPLPSSPLLSIFGEPKINLRIAGQIDIHGAWRNETTTGITTSALGNTRNEPDFKQQVQINLNGTIGDKLTILADWNTERPFQYENQLKLKYTGYEDEIIQSIEAGNVSLQTSPLVGGSEALFGIKALFKMGPFSLTALASQKKSEVQEISVSGGAKSQKFEIHAYDYSQNHFFVHGIYTDPALNIFNKFFGNPVHIYIDSLKVKEIEVWKTTTGLINPGERKANAYLNIKRRKEKQLYNDLRDNSFQTIPGKQEIDRRFVLLKEDVDYTYHQETGFISFKTQIQDQDAIAVAIRIEGPTSSQDDDIYFGEFLRDAVGDTTARLVLNLVKPPNLQPQFKDAWALQLRNIYPIGGRDVKEEGFVLDIKYRIEGQEPQDNFNGVKLLQTFGLDKTDKNGVSAQPDGAFDFFSNRTIFPKTGEIIFPVLQPFGKDLPSALPDTLRYSSVYETTVTFAKQDRAKDKFILTGEYSASVTSVFSIGFQAVEKSVKVLLNGNQLKEGPDYTVDYNLGQVIIRKNEALVPGADLKISYEQNDLFQLASKTMLGFRGLLELNRESSLGFSFLNLNQQTLSDKVRIGEEPLNNSIFGLDFKTNVELPFVTKALDKIISTSAPSNFAVNAEYAYINPDPNTKKSTIASDGGRSIAYVDDFEGAKKTIPLGVSNGSWKDISVPKNLPYIGNLDENLQMRYKAKAFWFNITPSDVTVQDIYGDRKKVGRDAVQIATLDFVYQPNQRGYYNNEPLLGETFKNWAGFMKPLSSTANNLIEENIEFVEFWVKIVEAPKDLKINIDLGQISEDIIPNRRLDTEDINDNDLLDDGEDVGLDGMKDAQEPFFNSATNPDPNNDNFSYKSGSGDFSRINGTEGNGVSTDLGRIPDTEDLNRNKTLDRVNSFYRYVIPLDTNRTTNPFVQGGGSNKGWYLYRVPLKDFVEKVGDPSFSVVETIRFYIADASQQVHLRFTEMNLVGNQWQKVLNSKVTRDDTVLTVSTINVEDNPEYITPPGVIREKDKTRPDQDIIKNEQALNLILTNLEEGDAREVVRYLTRPLDVFNYKEMKLFLRGDSKDLPGSVSYYKDEKDYATEIYLRFGSDTLNYYEYRQPVRYSRVHLSGGWNEVSMKFSELTAIKERRPGDSVKVLYSFPLKDLPGHSYGIKGNPTLTRISFFTIGIINPKDKGTPNQKVSGSVWVNELRVLEAEQTPGWAYAANASLRLADLLSINANISQTDPYFHKLSERFGAREERSNWGVAVDFDLLKIIPVNLSGSNFKISYARTESAYNPLYLPATDIKVDEAQKELRRNLEDRKLPADSIDSIVKNLRSDVQTVNVSETWALSNIRIKIPTEVWYIRDLFNNLSFAFNYNKTFGRNPATAISTAWFWNASANYSVNLNRDYYFKPADIPLLGYLFGLFNDYRDVKVYFLPQSITGVITANRRRNFNLARTLAAKPNIQRDFVATRGSGFNWNITEGGFANLSLGYNFDISSTLAHLLAQDDIERAEGQIWRDIFGGQFFGRDYNYKQNFDLRTNPKLPSLFDLNRFLTLNSSYSTSYTWQNNFQQEQLGRSAGYSSRLSGSMTIRVKSIFAPLFQEEEKPIQPSQQQVGGRTGGRRSQVQRETVKREVEKEADFERDIISKDTVLIKKDSLKTTPQDLEEETDTIETKASVFSSTLGALKLAMKWLLLDYDQVSVNFSQNSSYIGGGLAGEGTGFNNFWGVKQDYRKGPTRLFMLGLSNNIGPRAPKGNLQDNYTHRNDIDLRTSRALWQGAQIDLSWKIGWGINKSITIQTDSLGVQSLSNIVSTGTIDRSFLSLPPTLIFSFLGNGIKKVHELYDPRSVNPSKNLSDAFLKGFESFSILSKIPILSQLAKYIPRPNWSFSWTGLEQYSIFSFAKRVSLNHAYISNYSEGWKINPSGVEEVQTQKVDYAFSPLIGMTLNFDELWSGSFQSTLRYSVKTSYGLGVTTRNITESFTRDVSFTASYTKTGFDFPLFGISLKNDLEISISYSNAKTSSVIFEMDQFKEKGKPQEGKTNTMLEPKIRYVMSSRVTLSVFYRRTSIAPEGASRIPPTTTNEAGLDVRITISPN